MQPRIYARLLSLIGTPVLIGIIIFVEPGCRDADEFKPPEDTLSIPPEPPQLLSPPDYYVRMPEGPTGSMLFTWTPIEGAELYEVYYVGDTFAEWITTVDTNCYSFRMQKEPWQYLLAKFIWRVRAGSTKWQYYTDWSATRHFEIRFKPPPPQLLSPAPDTNLVFTSLPAQIIFDWDAVQDEQRYNIMILKDTAWYNELTTLEDSCILAFDSTGVYYWQVNAGSTYWQYSTDWSQPRRFTITMTE